MPTCARWPPASPPPPAPRSARWPRAATPRAPISPAPCRIATPAGIRSAAAGMNARDMLARAAQGLSTVRRRRALGRWPRRRCARQALGGAGVRGRADAVCRRDAQVRRARAAADRHVRRDLGHLRESRRPVAELRRRGQAAGRSAPGWKVLRVLGNLAGRRRTSTTSPPKKCAKKCARAAADVAAGSYQGSHEVAGRAPPECARRSTCRMYADRCGVASRAVAAAHA